ncbi:MAG: AAA family ATPase [Syntrophaceae bacterium]|nr:AAA family ATPase [Syntrophaceae bacterium]
MYKEFYRLQYESFNSRLRTDIFFDSHPHKEAWYYLLVGIDSEEPYLALTGEYGMGKTLLCLRLVEYLKGKASPRSKKKPSRRVEYLSNTNEGYGGLLRRIAMNLEISPDSKEEGILQEEIFERLKADKGMARFFLIIDDVQELDTTVLAKLKYLSTFSYDDFFPFVMIFIGHPSFLQNLTTPALIALSQRINRRYQLSYFNLEDTQHYIEYRLFKSGAKKGIPTFSPEAIEKIFEYSHGVPRQINSIADSCLLIGASSQLSVITPSVVDKAKEMVGGSLTVGGVDSGETETSATLMNKDFLLENALEQEHFAPSPLADVNEYQEEQEEQEPDIIVNEYQEEQEYQEPDILKEGKLTPSRSILKSILKVAVIIILTILLYTALSRYFMPGATDLLSHFLPSEFKSFFVKSEKTEMPPADHEAEEMLAEKTEISAADREAEEIPILRDEAKAVAPPTDVPAEQDQGAEARPAELKQSGVTSKTVRR